MLTRELEETLSYAVDEAVKHKHEYVTLEHLLFALLEDAAAREILFNCGAISTNSPARSPNILTMCLRKFRRMLRRCPNSLPRSSRLLVTPSFRPRAVVSRRLTAVIFSLRMYQAEQSYAVYLLNQQGVTRLDILNYIAHGISKIDRGEPLPDGIEDDELIRTNSATQKTT